MVTVLYALIPVFLYELLLESVFLALPGVSQLTSTLIGAVLAIILFGARFRKEPKKSLSIINIGSLMLFGAGSCILVNVLIKLSQIERWFPEIQAVMEALYTPPLLLQVIAVGIVIPIAE